MALRQPTTAILTVTLLAAASANVAWADCEQLRQQLVGQYGVVLRYQDGVAVVSPRCDAILAAKVVDTAAFAQCTAALQNLQASYQQANATYLQQTANYKTQCRTTATYGQAPSNPDDATSLRGSPFYGQMTPPANPGYATNQDGSPYSSDPTQNPYTGQPSDSEPITFQNPTSEDAQQIYQSDPGFIGGLFGGFGGRGGGSRGGGSRGGGITRHC